MLLKKDGAGNCPLHLSQIVLVSLTLSGAALTNVTNINNLDAPSTFIHIVCITGFILLNNIQTSYAPNDRDKNDLCIDTKPDKSKPLNKLAQSARAKNISQMRTDTTYSLIHCALLFIGNAARGKVPLQSTFEALSTLINNQETLLTEPLFATFETAFLAYSFIKLHRRWRLARGDWIVIEKPKEPETENVEAPNASPELT